MRDVISNETIKEINEVIDEILTNIDDNVRNIVGAGNYSLPTIFSYTNYSGQTINVHGSTFRHEIIIDNADGNTLIGDICTVIGDRKGIKLAKAGVEDRHDAFANYWDSSFDIAYDSDTAINGYVFDMHSGLVGEGTGQSKVMSFKLDNLKVGKAYTLTFRGKFVRAQFVSGQESLVRICSTTAETPYLAQVTLEKDTDAHIYRIDFTNNTQNTTLYLNFWFYGVDYDIETYNPEFIADDLIIAGMNIGIISRYIDYNGKWYPIEAGGGTSDLDAIELTYAEYQALTPAEKTDPDKIYFITDYPSGSGVVINPTGTATDTAETIEVDGTIYDFAGTDADAVHTADIGVAGGVAELDANGKVPSAQLPSYVDDVVEYASISAFPATGESGKIYIALDTNKTYRWTGSVYVEISPSLALGETSSTAYRGDRGKIAYDHSQSDHSGIAPAFTEASTRANIASGETFATLLGKIKKFFSDLKAVAFSGSYNDLSDQPTIPTKVSDLTDDVVSGHYLPLTGGTLTGNLNVSGSSDTSLYTHGNASGSHIGFRNQSGNTTYGYIGVKNDNLPYFYANSSKRIALLDEVPTKLSDLTNDLNKIKDIGNSTDTTFAYSKAGLRYSDYTWLAAWNGYELRAVGKTQFAQNYVEGRLSNSDSYTSLAHGYYGGSAGTYWRIAFPDNTVTTWNMINMTVSVSQTWNPSRGGKVMINTYHNATSPYTWQGFNASVIGNLTDDIKVYGSDGKYIYIGGCTQGYTTLLIDDLLIGDSARSQDFKGTTVDMVSALPATYQTASMVYYIQNGVTNTFNNKSDNTPVYVQDGSSGSNGSTIGYKGHDGTIFGYIGVTGAKKPYFYDTARREIITSATIGSQSVDKATKDGDGNTISSTYIKVRTTTDSANYNTALNISAYNATKPIFGYVSVISNLSAGANFYIPFSFMKDVVPAGTKNYMGVQGGFRFMFQFTDSPRSIKMVQAVDANGNDATTNNTIKFYLYRNY